MTQSTAPAVVKDWEPCNADSVCASSSFVCCQAWSDTSSGTFTCRDSKYCAASNGLSGSGSGSGVVVTTHTEAPAPATEAPSVPTQASNAEHGSGSASLTYYSPETGGAFCDGHVYSSYDLIVAISNDLMQGHSNCGKTIRVFAGNGYVDATVVDQCDTNGGCTPGNIDGTTRLWAALGLGLGAGRVQVTYSIL
ncbi:hypothetical protein HDU91_003937 [Kappamyces sp. JEL0680]|nr:hypothetical protein HDU91_003937 [Kappamyces sp. JEL0680]